MARGPTTCGPMKRPPTAAASHRCRMRFVRFMTVPFRRFLCRSGPAATLPCFEALPPAGQVPVSDVPLSPPGLDGNRRSYAAHTVAVAPGRASHRKWFDTGTGPVEGAARTLMAAPEAWCRRRPVDSTERSRERRTRVDSRRRHGEAVGVIRRWQSGPDAAASRWARAESDDGGRRDQCPVMGAAHHRGCAVRQLNTSSRERGGLAGRLFGHRTQCCLRLNSRATREHVVRTGPGAGSDLSMARESALSGMHEL